MKDRTWDYLIVTASNERQAEAYEAQLDARRELGLLRGIRDVLVIPDPGGKRIGSGGSTLYCLMEILSRRLRREADRSSPAVWQRALAELRILIVHAGGDSRRLPAYSACGKIFIPVPGKNDGVVYLSLFDRLLPTFLALPTPTEGRGQVVIASGDVLLQFNPTQVRFAQAGVTSLACYASPQQASRHGVFCRGEKDEVRLYLQKPSVVEQKEQGAINTDGQSCLDIGVTHLDAATAVLLLRLFGAKPDATGRLAFAGTYGQVILEQGLDFYREICCALGRQTSPEHHIRSAHESGSKWTAAHLGELFGSLSSIPFSVQLLPHCAFLDFGMNRGLIQSGTRLLQEDQGLDHLQMCVDVNNEITAGGAIQGSAAWVEGCRLSAPLMLGGSNAVVGVDIAEPLSLPTGACLDVIGGRDERGGSAWFVRCYGLDDAFKEPVGEGAAFCGVPLQAWLTEIGADQEEVWSPGTERKNRTIWNARLFPAVKHHSEYRQWLWMFEPTRATQDQHQVWRSAPRYSLEQMLTLADHRGFYERRRMIRAKMTQVPV